MSTDKHTRTYSLEEAKAEIERLIEEMVTGQSITISKAAPSEVAIAATQYDDSIMYPPKDGKREGGQFGPGTYDWEEQKKLDEEIAREFYESYDENLERSLGR